MGKPDDECVTLAHGDSGLLTTDSRRSRPRSYVHLYLHLYVHENKAREPPLWPRVLQKPDDLDRETTWQWARMAP